MNSISSLILTTCEGSQCPSKHNCKRFLERRNSESKPAALWLRRQAGDTACDLYEPKVVVSTFKDFQ